VIQKHTALKIAELNDKLNEARERIKELERELKYYRENQKRIEVNE
jgi:predicted RNase H-like nuclease (RuvC/YqgF family)